MSGGSDIFADSLVVIIDLLYRTHNHNDMAYEFFERLSKLIPFDAGIYNHINYATLELQEGRCFSKSTRITQSLKSLQCDPSSFDLSCLTHLNVSADLTSKGSQKLNFTPECEQQPSFQYIVGVVAGWRQLPIAAIRLFRRGQSPNFSDYETNILDRLTIHIANAAYLHSIQSVYGGSTIHNGLLIFDKDGNVLYQNGLVSKMLTGVPPDSILQIAQNGGIWLKKEMDLYRVENIPITPSSLLASYANHGKPSAITASLDKPNMNLFTTQDIALISIKPFQRRSAFENRLKLSGLSRREIDVTLKVMSGLSNKNIAKEMFIDETTVKDHLQHIYAKINIKTRTQLISKVLGLDIELANHAIPNEFGK